jgi:hypothetical protein
VFRGVVAASLVSLALVGCSAQSLAPSHRAGSTNQIPQSLRVQNASASASAVATLLWNPTFIKLRDGGPYAGTLLTYTHGDTVVVNYDDPCDYHIDLDIHPGPVKHNVETDEYDFYAYTGKSGSPTFHCKVHASLKDAGGQVVARAALAVTITYPTKHGHGG